MYNIGIVGTGQLGSRHLQALVHLKVPATIFVVDPSPKSLITAQKRWGEVKGKEDQIHFLSSVENLPESLDLVIIATGAGNRRAVIEQVFSHTVVRNLILEKFLFQEEKDFSDMQNILLDNNCKAWVNCPRRLYPDYISLKEKLQGPLVMSVTGSNWGLACNSIHWVDTFSWLTGETPVEFIPLLQSDFIPSKRAGFIEFNGSLLIKGNQGSSLFLHSFSDGDHTLTADIADSRSKFIIKELTQKMWESSAANGWTENELKFQGARQSELTNLVAEQILVTGECDLPRYEESMQMHLPLLDIFLSRYNASTGNFNNSICPIT